MLFRARKSMLLLQVRIDKMPYLVFFDRFSGILKFTGLYFFLYCIRSFTPIGIKYAQKQPRVYMCWIYIDGL